MLNFHAVYTKVNVTKNCQAGQLQLNSYSSAQPALACKVTLMETTLMRQHAARFLNYRAKFDSYQRACSYIFPNCPWLGLKNV
jgi:hypothetical protein